MKKLICLFGQPGSGRKTLINNIINKNEDVLRTFDLECNNIFCASIEYDRDVYSSDYRAKERRFNQFSNMLQAFKNSHIDTLIINCEHVDYYDGNDSILNIIEKKFPELEKIIYLLNPEDINVGYERLRNTEWFKKGSDSNYKFSIDWYKFAIPYMRKSLSRFDGLGYSVYEVDTTDGYVIHKDKPKALEKK